MKKILNLKETALLKVCSAKALRIIKLTNLLLLVTIFNVFGSNLQQRQITGKVTGPDNEPLPGVTVVVKGTMIGTLSDANGNFSLSIPSEAKTLSFSFVGMNSQELTIGNQTVFNVKMEVASIGLEEVVVVGYGTQQKVTLTGAVSAIKSNDLDEKLK